MTVGLPIPRVPDAYIDEYPLESVSKNPFNGPPGAVGGCEKFESNVEVVGDFVDGLRVQDTEMGTA
ncbi:hypothetical protein [Halodesulfurarchaeum sp.]|uniref:hypothetical protein n=1 Tax=Halodesulfurarchaeum sp. TaxID=1980530 RepID=UPI002FC359CE